MDKRNNFKRQIPEDFVEFADGKSLAQIIKHYRCAVRTAIRWRNECGLKPISENSPPPRFREVPDDLAENCRTKSVNGLAKHYRTGHDTIKRWLAKTGLRASTFQPSSLGRMGTPLYGQMHYTKMRTLFDEAADILRKERWVVYRCDERGEYAQGGKWYRVGNIVCTPDELLQRSERYR